MVLAKGARLPTGEIPLGVPVGIDCTGYTNPTFAALEIAEGDYEVFVKCINGRFALPITYIIARMKRKPFILWTGIWVRLQTPVQRLVFPLTRYIYRHSDAVVVYGEHVKRYLIDEGVSARKIFVASHATDNAFYAKPVQKSRKAALRLSLNASVDKKIILYLGRLEESKGVEFLLKAFVAVSCSEAMLVIAGTGSLENSLRDLAHKLGIDARTRFCGYVPIEEAPLYYSQAWIFVLPSITTKTGKEPWGLVVNEAFNQGVPVVVTEAVGAAAGGLVKDGLNGFVVPERDSRALAKALDRLLASPDLHREFGARARQDVSSWNYVRNVEGYLQAIDYVSKVGASG